MFDTLPGKQKVSSWQCYPPWLVGCAETGHETCDAKFCHGSAHRGTRRLVGTHLRIEDRQADRVALLQNQVGERGREELRIPSLGKGGLMQDRGNVFPLLLGKPGGDVKSDLVCA